MKIIYLIVLSIINFNYLLWSQSQKVSVIFNSSQLKKAAEFTFKIPNTNTYEIFTLEPGEEESTQQLDPNAVLEKIKFKLNNKEFIFDKVLDMNDQLTTLIAKNITSTVKPTVTQKILFLHGCLAQVQMSHEGYNANQISEKLKEFDALYNAKLPNNHLEIEHDIWQSVKIPAFLGFSFLTIVGCLWILKKASFTYAKSLFNISIKFQSIFRK